MKIVFCKSGFAGPISGADAMAVTYAVELKAAGHITEVLLVHPPAGDDHLVARLRAADVPLVTLASPLFSASFGAARRLAIRAMRACSPASNLIRSNSRKVVFDLLQRYHDACCAYLKRTRPDVLHVLTPDQGAVMLIRAAHATGVPIVYQEVGIPYHPPGFEEVYERFVTVLPLCAGVAVLSPLLAQEVIRVLPQVATPYVLPLMSQDTLNGYSRNGDGAESICFGFAGRLEYLKGPLELIEAFALAHKVLPGLELKLAGSGSQRQEIFAALRRLDLERQCQLAGVYQDCNERSKFMSSIDVFVLPSRTEGTPNAIIEAMVHGKPIIATEVGGIPDVVSADVGILVPPNDVRALADAIKRLAADRDLRKRMGQAARRKYEQIFTPRAVMPLLTGLYERVVNDQQNRNGGGGSHPQPVAGNGGHPWANS